MSGILKADSGDALPQHLTVPIESFDRYKDHWLLWRNLGHYSDSGAWIPPVSFIEAVSMPKDMLDVFIVLDEWLYKMIHQKKNNGK